MESIIGGIEAIFEAMPLPFLEVWGGLGYLLGLALMVCAFGGFTLRPGGQWKLGRERQTWDAKALRSIILTFVLILLTGYLGSFIVLVPGAQTFESLKDLAVFVCIVLFGYPALIIVPFAYGLSDLIESVPPSFLLDWLPGYFINPACFWMAYQLIGKNPDFRQFRTWGWYMLFVLAFMSIEPQLWGYICAGKFTPEISYRIITPALLFTTTITWLIAPFAMLLALPLARRFGMYWAEIPGHVRECVLGRKGWVWEAGTRDANNSEDEAGLGLPIRMFLATPFIVLVLVMVGSMAYITLSSAENSAHKLAVHLHQESSENINLYLDDYLEKEKSQDKSKVGRIDDINRLLSHLPIAEHGRAFIVDRTGRLVASSGNPASDSPSGNGSDLVVHDAINKLSQTVGNLQTLKIAIQFQFDVVTAKPLSRETWLAQATPYSDRSAKTDWILMTVMPAAYYLEGVRTGNSRSAIVFATALTLALFVAAYLATIVTIPIRRISYAARQLMKGDLTQRVPDSRLQELGTLSRAFNNMAEQLQKSFDNLLGEAEMRKGRERELEESEIRFRQLAEQAPIGIMLLDAAGKVTYVNQHWCDIVELTQKEAMNVKWTDILYPDDREWVIDQWSQALRSKTDCVIECRQQSKTGGVAWVKSRATARRIASGEVTGYIVITSNVTAQKLYDEKVARLNRIHSVLSGINSAIVRIRDRQLLFDEACRIVVDHGKFRFARIALWDAAGNRLHSVAKSGESIDAFVPSRYIDQDIDIPREPGYPGDEFRSKHPSFCNDIADDLRMAERREAYLKCGIRAIILLPLTIAGQSAGILFIYSAVPDVFTEEEVKLLEELSGDVSFALEHIQKAEQLNYLAYYDELTGLPNLRLFQDRLGQLMEKAVLSNAPLGVIVMDIERFRHINDSFGRKAGDELLKAIADRIKIAVGDQRRDRIARMGPNSFAVIITTTSDSAVITQRLEAALSTAFGTPIMIAGENLLISMKSGIALFPGDGTDPESLLRNAEAALKEAKSSGEKLVFYEKALNAQVAQRLALENRLRCAVELEQFVLHYQPKVDLLNGNIKSVEALIRWNSPDMGLVPPGDFIPILENTGLIREVGRWAISRAISDYATLRTLLPHPPRIAVNVSALQLRQTNFVNEIQELIQKSESDDHGLDLEITESLLMRGVEDNIRKLQAVREMNIRIAVDDFGTGYSSLSYIAKLPIDLLKIDRAFITDMCSNNEDMTIVSAIVSLAHSLNLKVVAEGVETEEQAQALRDLLCDEAQGYLFCKPVPLDVLIERLTSTGK
jgi:diguanylate cyclase (GGDEF)-like protein/PAS domain S-box-containing protein